MVNLAPTIDTVGTLPDHDIRHLAIHHNMIFPFVGKAVNKTCDNIKILSYGLSSVGYDVRLSNRFKIFSNSLCSMIDPLNIKENYYVNHSSHSEECTDYEQVKFDENNYCVIPPNSYVLSRSIEYFNMPNDVYAIALGKSSLARIGLLVNTTPIEPGFSGHIVIEVANLTPIPMKCYSGMGISQFIFFRTSKPPNKNYKDKNAGNSGKYQNQEGIQGILL